MAASIVSRLLSYGSVRWLYIERAIESRVRCVWTWVASLCPAVLSSGYSRPKSSLPSKVLTSPIADAAKDADPHAD
jgi:hypothetical protein